MSTLNHQREGPFSPSNEEISFLSFSLSVSDAPGSQSRFTLTQQMNNLHTQRSSGMKSNSDSAYCLFTPSQELPEPETNLTPRLSGLTLAPPQQIPSQMQQQKARKDAREGRDIRELRPSIG